MDTNKSTLLVMAAGMGSRFGGLKQIEPLGPNGEVILDYSVYDAKEAGFSKVVFVIKKEIEEDFRNAVGKRIENKIDVSYAFQDLNDLPKGFSVCLQFQIVHTMLANPLDSGTGRRFLHTVPAL